MPQQFQVCWALETSSLCQSLDDCFTTYGAGELMFMTMSVSRAVQGVG